jgi:transcriptional regulator with XRE-family HTH domain
MEKIKLIEARKMKGLLQNDIAEKLCMDTSCYSRREKGEIKITISQWEKLAQILEVPLKEIFEPEENQTFINKDNVQINYQGTQYIHPIPDSLLESQQKLIRKLEEEIAELKVLLQQK